MKSIVIIGAGIAGLSTALDLTLRGFKCFVIDKGVVGSGTTTKCAGMLHSGARYVVNSFEIAKLCNRESEILKNIVPFAINNEKGLFVIPENANSEYISVFEKNSKKADITLKKISKQDCRNLEIQLSQKIKGGFETPDAVVNPFLIVESYKEELVKLGTDVMEFNNLVSGKYRNGKWMLCLENSKNRNKKVLTTDMVIIAAGSWSGEVASKLGLKLDLVYIQGTMFSLKSAVCKRVVSICAPNTTGDVIIPSGSVSLVGSTWHELNSNKLINITKKDKKDVVKVSNRVFPDITLDEIGGYFSGIRTHVRESSKSKEKFAVDRNYAVIDHEENDNIPNVYTILSGKLTFGRLVAEIIVDKICEKLSINTICKTSRYVLKKPKSFSNTELAYLSIN